MNDPRELLLWARAHGFRVNEIQVGDVRMVVDDLKADGADVTPEPQPTTPHGQWAKHLGLDVKVVDDMDDDEAGPS